MSHLLEGQLKVLCDMHGHEARPRAGIGTAVVVRVRVERVRVEQGIVVGSTQACSCATAVVVVDVVAVFVTFAWFAAAASLVSCAFILADLVSIFTPAVADANWAALVVAPVFALALALLTCAVADQICGGKC